MWGLECERNKTTLSREPYEGKIPAVKNQMTFLIVFHVVFYSEEEHCPYNKQIKPEGRFYSPW